MASAEFCPNAIGRVLPGSFARKPPFGAFAAITPTLAASVVTRYPFPVRHVAVDPALKVDGSPRRQPARSRAARTRVGRRRRIFAPDCTATPGPSLGEGSDTSAVSRSPRPLLLALLAVSLASAAPAFARSSGPLIVYGYPYASRCPTAGYGDVVDRWGMYMCNCTSYVAWALGANGQRTDWFVRGAMNAGNWPHA